MPGTLMLAGSAAFLSNQNWLRGRNERIQTQRYLIQMDFNVRRKRDPLHVHVYSHKIPKCRIWNLFPDCVHSKMTYKRSDQDF